MNTPTRHTIIQAYVDMNDPRRDTDPHFMKWERHRCSHKWSRFQFKKLVKRLTKKGYLRIDVTVFRTNTAQAMSNWVRSGSSVAKQVWSYNATTGRIFCEED